MSINEKIIEILKQEKTYFIVSVPCNLLGRVIDLVNNDPFFKHVSVTREEEGIGLCAGAYLSDIFTCMLLQNSGLGNSINAIASLLNCYEIPMLLLISHRGTIGEKITAQIPMGKATPKLLDAINVEYKILKKPNQVNEIRVMIKKSKETSKPVAVLLPFSFWGGLP
jgi:sulfopyruvate decarboxylase subunit alpha